VNDDEKELLAAMLAAPASEIDKMEPATVGKCKDYLGLDGLYEPQVHYPLVLAKLRRQWAQAMLAEARGKP